MSKSAILEKIKKNKPELVALPDLSVFQHDVPREELIKDFISVSTGNMSNVVSIIDSEVPLQTYLKEFISKNFPLATTFYDTLKIEANPSEVDFTQTPVDLFIAEAKLGVAENGGLWFDDSILKQRISTFACEHTLMIINHKNIVPTMHQAYQKIKISETGYCVLIAGPSKTADIEQSLVVGAQGAVSNTTIII
ncbi:LUD domain-containing protein [Zunongwangia sp. F260]|uniref:LUD domain-containing protein n=1 Tax=Autumnicola lenta TaxID=3075593 RepID=A0ABU3CQ03_9FLAO|nr:LUD domain-containing protein [Zunongwangia sp. F260]MDT0648010.1 LUD domain-containing protein [Zunongwangia sp. F260]